METTTTALLMGIASLIGALITPISKFIVELFSNKHKIEKESIQQEFEQLRTERTAIFDQHKVISDDLQKQIMDLREQVEKLNVSNINYIQENAEFRVRISIVTIENKELRERIIELETEVGRLVKEAGHNRNV